MKDFKKQGSFGGQRGGGNFSRPPYGGGNRSSGGRDDGFGRSQMFEAICANCGKKCEVPFRPNGQKPVYCRDCFGKRDGLSPGNFPRRDFGARPNFQRSRDQSSPRDSRIDDIKRQLDVMHDKLNQLLSAARDNKPKTEVRSETEIMAERVEREVKGAKPEKGTKKKAASKKR